MNLSWTRLAMDNLRGHYSFLKSQKGVKAARKWRKSIFDKVEYLKNYPRLGHNEKSKLYPNHEIRSISEGTFKKNYIIDDQDVIVINILDMRQNPDKHIF
jgi:plasmid stabilization system protein ParE